MRQDDTKARLRKALRAEALDPFRFEDFLAAWNTFFTPDQTHSTDDLEADATAALHAISADADTHFAGPTLRRMLNTFPNPALVVRPDGLIIGQNAAAMTVCNVDSGDSVDRLPFALNGGALMSEQTALLFDRRNADDALMFHSAIADADGRNLTVALMPARGDDARALIFVIDPRGNAQTMSLLARAYDLTPAESEVLGAFIDGVSLPGIAAARDRSLATVRTQLQTIMAKAGVSSQAELMRNALAMAQFHDDIQSLGHIAAHPHRKRLNILRKGGRSVEVILAGQMSGDLVIFIPDTTLCFFTARTETAFARAGLCVATVCRPGFGATDPSTDADYEAAMADDIIAVQDQLGFSRTPVMAHSTSTGYAYRLGGLIPHRITRIVCLSTLVPMPMLDTENTTAPWAVALMKGARASPAMFRLMVSAGVKAWKIMGSRRFVTLQLSQNPTDVAIATRPDQLEAIDASMRACSAQGITYAAKDLEIATRDWSDWAQDCTVPVILFHGTADPIAPIGPVRAFATRFPGNITLDIIPDGGFMIYTSHIDRLIPHLKT